MLTILQLNNLREAAKHAAACETTTGVPAELTVAQWALESGWGKSQPGNNCFGIKAYPMATGTQLLFTREYFTDEELKRWQAAKFGRTAVLENGDPDANGRKRYKCQDFFATFPTLAHCFIKRGTLFHTPKYQPFLNKYKENGNFVEYVQGISPIYATDPDYSDKILSIASIPEVQSAILEAKRG